jgi:hypothetical protein
MPPAAYMLTFAYLKQIASCYASVYHSLLIQCACDYSCITVIHNHPTPQIYPLPITNFSKNEILQLGHQIQSKKEMKDTMALVRMEI